MMGEIKSGGRRTDARSVSDRTWRSAPSDGGYLALVSGNVDELPSKSCFNCEDEKVIVALCDIGG